MYYSSATAICVNILIAVSPPIKSIECYHYSCSRAHLFFHPGKNGESSRVETSQFFGTNPVLTCSSCHCLSAGIAICSTMYVPLFNSTGPSSKNFKHNLGMKGSSLKVGNGVNKTLKSKTIAPDNGKRRTVWTSRRKWISSTFSLGDFQSVILILSVRLVNYGLTKHKLTCSPKVLSDSLGWSGGVKSTWPGVKVQLPRCMARSVGRLAKKLRLDSEFSKWQKTHIERIPTDSLIGEFSLYTMGHAHEFRSAVCWFLLRSSSQKKS